VAALAALMLGRAVFITGVEDDPGGVACRVYVGPRYHRRYFLVSDPDARAECERAWRGSRGHVIADRDDLAAVGVLLQG
jgi:hypothetical protein